MKQKIIKVLFYSNLTVVGIAIGLNLAFPISPGYILTGIGALCAAIVCGMEINRERRMNK